MYVMWSVGVCVHLYVWVHIHSPQFMYARKILAHLLS